MIHRPRRNRASAAMRSLVRETTLTPANLILPLFVQEGEHQKTPIVSMPGVFRYSIDELLHEAERAFKLGIPGVALFPALHESVKDHTGRESVNPHGLLQRTVHALKKELPELLVITDVALDPYSSDGHDGLVRDGQILNDETLPLLAQMAVAQAEAGADVVAPSDMMDGRVAAIREALDVHDFENVAICSYCAKYASAFYGPFRDALDSAPKSGDKKTYQMDRPMREGRCARSSLDEAEGRRLDHDQAVGLPYLDVVALARASTNLPVAYHVSGEFAMLKAAAEKGWLNYDACLLESLTALRRAGADIIWTYGAIDAAKMLRY
ncbi:MAG: porphobilinogen synthase [Bryobacterales bacterium]